MGATISASDSSENPHTKTQSSVRVEAFGIGCSRVYPSVEWVELPTRGGIEAPKVRPIAAQGNALGMPCKKPKDLNGRPNSWAILVTITDRLNSKHTVHRTGFLFREKRSELFLKRLHAMVLLLIANVVRHFRDIGFAHRERAVSRLPRKARQRRPCVLIHLEDDFFTSSTTWARVTVRPMLKSRCTGSATELMSTAGER